MLTISEQEIPKKKFLNGFHLFRGLSILLIVASHILAQDPAATYFVVLQSIFLNSTLFFVFTSGFLFQHLIHKFEYKSFLVRKLQKVLLPYFLVSIPAIAFRILGGAPFYTLNNYPDFESWSLASQIGYYLVSGAHLLPLWFIPMITLFFVISPILRYIDQHPKLFAILLPVGLSLALVFPRADINEITNTFRMFAHFFGVYILGMFCSHFKSEADNFVKRHISFIIFIGLVYFALSLIPIDAEWRANVIFIGKLHFVFILLYLLERNKSELVNKVLSYLANISFGIYFVHYFAVIAVRDVFKIVLGHHDPTRLVEWIVQYGLVLIVTLVMIVAVRTAFKKRSVYLIGC